LEERKGKIDGCELRLSWFLVRLEKQKSIVDFHLRVREYWSEPKQFDFVEPADSQNPGTKNLFFTKGSELNG
jgi:hypothetical protein